MRRLAVTCFLTLCVAAQSQADEITDATLKAYQNTVAHVQDENAALKKAVADLKSQLAAAQHRVDEAESVASAANVEAGASEAKLKAAQDTSQANAATVARSPGEHEALISAQIALQDLQRKYDLLKASVSSGKPMPDPRNLRIGQRVDPPEHVKVLQVLDGHSALLSFTRGTRPIDFRLEDVDTSGMVDDAALTLPGPLEVVRNFTYQTAEGSQRTIWAMRLVKPTTQP